MEKLIFEQIFSEITYHEVVDQATLYASLKNDCEPPVIFAINRNLYACVKMTNCKWRMKFKM